MREMSLMKRGLMRMEMRGRSRFVAVGSAG